MYFRKIRYHELLQILIPITCDPEYNSCDIRQLANIHSVFTTFSFKVGIDF